MRNLLLSVALIAAPIAVFAAGYTLLVPAAPAVGAAVAISPLGDLEPYKSIVADVHAMAMTGDLAGAKARIADLETAWDQAQPTLRPRDTLAWGTVDAAIDDALTALRTGTPDAAQVEKSLAVLQIALADPASGAGTAVGVASSTGSGIATTGANGRALPCEVMLETFRQAQAKAALSGGNRAKVDLLRAKGTDRCNADDDPRADDFFAQGLALMSN